MRRPDNERPDPTGPRPDCEMVSHGMATSMMPIRGSLRHLNSRHVRIFVARDPSRLEPIMPKRVSSTKIPGKPLNVTVASSAMAGATGATCSACSSGDRAAVVLTRRLGEPQKRPVFNRPEYRKTNPLGQNQRPHARSHRRPLPESRTPPIRERPRRIPPPHLLRIPSLSMLLGTGLSLPSLPSQREPDLPRPEFLG